MNSFCAAGEVRLFTILNPLRDELNQLLPCLLGVLYPCIGKELIDTVLNVVDRQALILGGVSRFRRNRGGTLSHARDRISDESGDAADDPADGRREE